MVIGHMVKYILVETRRGKFSSFKAVPVSGKRLKDAQNSDVEIFDSRPEAKERALELKKGR